MLSAVLERLPAERPDVEVVIAANHPEIFENNPRVLHCVAEKDLKRRAPAELESFQQMRFRQPEERRGQLAGHLIDDMAACLGLTPGPHCPSIYLTEEEEDEGMRLAPSCGWLRVAVAPFGKTNVRLPNKIYPADQWSRLGELLAPRDLQILQLGASDEGPLLEGAGDYRDLGYRATAALLKQCDLLVTHVGGLMHLARAVGLRSVVLYGAAEHPAISGYPENRNLYVPIECGPCWMEEQCDHHSCMRRLTPEIVLEAVLDELRAGRAKPA